MDKIKMDKIKNKHSFFEYSAVLLISCLATFYVFRSLHPTIPMNYYGDEVSNQAIFKVMLETGSPLPLSNNHNFGVPLGTNELDYPTSDSLHFFFIYIFLLLFKDAVIANNLYYLLTFLFASLAAYYALRKFAIPLFIALPGAISFSFIPFHILREHHIFLSGYYLIPLIILLAYKVDHGELTITNQVSIKTLISDSKKWKPGGFWILVIVSLIFGASGIYYAFFAVYLIFLLGLKSLFVKKYQISITQFFMAGMICLSVFINISPSLFHKWVEGPTSINIGGRNPRESEVFGLKIIQMMLPSAIHHIDSFRELNGEYRKTFPNVNENHTTSQGIIGSTGFLLALFFLFTKHREDPLVGYLGFTNLGYLLLGTVGGFGTLFAFFISPSIRAYNRVSVFISFIAIALFCLVARDLYEKYVSAGKDRYCKYIALGLFSGLVFFDQLMVAYPYHQEDILGEYLSDKRFVSELESQLPDGGMIFQLPFMEYPEGTPVRDLLNYDHFKVYLHSSTVRWSYGAMKGRESSEWNRRTAGLPIEEMITALSVTGFSGIELDREGYSRQERSDLENTLKDYLDVTPIISQNGRLVFFDLQPFNKKLVNQLDAPDWGRFAAYYGSLSIFKGEFIKPDGEGNIPLPCNGKQGILSLTNVNEEILPTTVSFDVRTDTGGKANLRIKSQGWEEITPLDGEPVNFLREVNTGRDPLNIVFSCEIGGKDPADEDAKEMKVLISEFKTR